MSSGQTTIITIRQWKNVNLLFMIICIALNFIVSSTEAISNRIQPNQNRNFLSSRTSSSASSSSSSFHSCPKSLACNEGFFDEGKDCHETNRAQCNCIAHCCFAFDCRDWGRLVECRRKCDAATPNRFGLKRTDKLECDKFPCMRSFYDQSWDSRDANDRQKNCIEHCCYAFDCRRALGYCRPACGIDAWVTARPLG